MKVKVITKTKLEFTKWIKIGNLFAKSLCPENIILKQYNDLTPSQRLQIKNLFEQYEKTRRKKIPTGETSNHWELGIMVDAHIIACEYNINPLTVILCINPICKPNEKILIR